MPDTKPHGRRVHVHVPYADFDKYSSFLRENRLSVELYIGSHVIDGITDADLEDLKRAMDWEHTLSIHSPFMDLSPGAVDSKIAAATLERYMQVMDIAAVLRPEVVVFHAGYESWKYGGDVSLWLGQSLKTWRRVMERASALGVKVAIENIVDAGPAHLKLLAREMAHPLFGLCLDVGHREIFSPLPIKDWVDGMHPYIFELHLHDNAGVNDDHLAIGQGKIDFGSLFARLRELAAEPVYTIEAHSEQDALKSLKVLDGYLS